MSRTRNGQFLGVISTRCKSRCSLKPMASATKTWANSKLAASGKAGTADNGSGGKQGGVRSPKQKELAGKARPHILEEHTKEGIKVHEFASKGEAHAAGTAMRREGKDVSVHEKGSKWAASAQHPEKVIGSSGDGGEQKRDDQGRFA